MRLLLMMPLLALGACATVETQREQQPVFTGSTLNTADQVYACFYNRMIHMPRVRYSARAHGGTIRGRRGLIARYVNLVIDIDDIGPARRVVVHASSSSRRNYPEAITELQTCLQPINAG
jgi:hypothetical protein